MNFLLTPSWIDQVKAPRRANVRTDFDGGGSSRLRLSNIPVEASFIATWEQLNCGVSLDDLLDFYAQVEDVEAFQLPNVFFQGIDIDVRNRIQASSPTGDWIFSGEMITTRVGLSKLWRASIKIVSTIT